MLHVFANKKIFIKYFACKNPAGTIFTLIKYLFNFLG